jgi:hypothetical protein
MDYMEPDPPKNSRPYFSVAGEERMHLSPTVQGDSANSEQHLDTIPRNFSPNQTIFVLMRHIFLFLS